MITITDRLPIRGVFFVVLKYRILLLNLHINYAFNKYDAEISQKDTGFLLYAILGECLYIWLVSQSI